MCFNEAFFPEKKRIAYLHQDEKSIFDIGRIVGRSGSVMKRIFTKFKSSESIEYSFRSGRPRKTSPRHDLVITIITSERVQEGCWNISAIKFSKKHLSKWQAKQSFGGYVILDFLLEWQLRNLLSKINRRTRISFDNEHVVWTNDKLLRIHFSAKSKYNVIGSDGKLVVRRRTGERLSVECENKSVKFRGGSVTVSGMMSAAGCGSLLRLHGIVNA